MHQIPRFFLIAFASLLALVIYALLPANGPLEPEAIGKSNFDNLQRAYDRWETMATPDDPAELAIGLAWNKGLSATFTSARGLASLDLDEGTLRVRVKGADGTLSDVWMVANRPGEGRSTRPEEGDVLTLAGRLTINGEFGVLDAQVDVEKLSRDGLNWIVVGRRDEHPGEGGLLFGSVSLFQKVRHAVRAVSAEASGWGPKGVRAQGIVPPDFPDASLINLGRDIFFNETFGGNGRTCGTCHREDNNFTIEPRFIATLPSSDALFVAERPAPNPLSDNFEKPELMRKVGLILENTNGFGDLENSFTMRGVPHVLGMRTSLSAPTMDGTTIPPDERTGWSGDGSPTNLAAFPQLRGTLRDFAVGAVTQHFPRTLNRTAGVDFRLPTELELDALEAFQLSLGRQDEFDDLTQIVLTDERADRGRENFLGDGLANGIPCNACHFNGGANTDPTFDFPAVVTPPAFESTNRSFAPRVEELLDQAGDVVDASNNPFDDGFGAGTSLFNVPTAIEAADTGPFFHGNQIETVEGLVAFYSSQRVLRDGTVLPPIVGLNGSQVANVGAFLRVVNADENLRTADEILRRNATLFNFNARVINLRLVLAELEDAQEVLAGGALHFDDAAPLIARAERFTGRALATTNFSSRNFFMAQARIAAQDARDAMIDRTP